jgi:hypothetical protein
MRLARLVLQPWDIEFVTDTHNSPIVSVLYGAVKYYNNLRKQLHISVTTAQFLVVQMRSTSLLTVKWCVRQLTRTNIT